jgi:hypothetical protein
MTVKYVWSKLLQDVCDQLPANLGRSSMVHDLIRAFGLLRDVVEPDMELGSRMALERYHDPSYLETLSTGKGLEYVGCPTQTTLIVRTVLISLHYLFTPS